MDTSADDILLDKDKDAPEPSAMLQEAEWLNVHEAGRSLNFMCSLYYEVSPELPDSAEDEKSPASSEGAGDGGRME